LTASNSLLIKLDRRDRNRSDKLEVDDWSDAFEFDVENEAGRGRMEADLGHFRMLRSADDRNLIAVDDLSIVGGLKGMIE
jgi:hypothetical protein